MMALALRTVDSRWAMTKTVRPSIRRSMPFSIRASVRVSIELVASSRNQDGRVGHRRAGDGKELRWPWDRLAPSEVMRVS